MHHEFCGRCGCPNDHQGKYCAHTVKVRIQTEGPATEDDFRERICPCQSGVRTDVYLNVQMSAALTELRKVTGLLQDLVMVQLEAHNLEIEEETGRLTRKVNLKLV